MMAGDSQRVVETTTINYNGMFAVLDPTSSWAAKWLHIGARSFAKDLPARLFLLCCPVCVLAIGKALCCALFSSATAMRLLGAGKRMPGCYALRVQADLPQHIEVSASLCATVASALLAGCSACLDSSGHPSVWCIGRACISSHQV